MKLNKLGAFAIGTLFGIAGIKALSSKDARKYMCTLLQQPYAQKKAL